MMPETAQEPAGPPACAELRRRADELLDEYDAVMAGARAGRMPPDQGRRIVLLTYALRELRTQLHRVACDEAYVEEAEARAEARGFELGRAAAGRHRVSRQRTGPQWLHKVYDGKAPAVIPGLAAAGQALRHLALPLTGTAAVAGGIAFGAQQLAQSPHAAAGEPHARSYAAASLDPVQAVPVITIPPSSGKHARLDADSARPLSVTVTPSWPLRQPAPAPSPVSSQAPAPGTLDVTQMELVTGPAGSAELDFSAIGGGLRWWAWASDGVSVSLSTGTLASGQPQSVTVTLGPGVTAGTVWVGAGGQAVAVPVAG